MALDNITYSSRVVNGQLVPVLEWQALASGNATGPIYGGGPASPATVPPNASTKGMSASGGGSGTGGPSVRLVIVLLAMLFVGILGLRYIHWRG